MKKFVIGAYCFVILCIIISFVAIPTTDKNSPSSQEIKTGSSSNNSLSYIVKDFNGNIAVFEESSSTPFKVTEVCTNTLPKVDQEKLIAGIVVKSQAELNTLLEDLCS